MVLTKKPFLIFSLSESYYDDYFVKSLCKFCESNSLQHFVYARKNVDLGLNKENIFCSSVLESQITEKDHRIYECLFDYALEVGATNIIIPRLINPEFFLSSISLYDDEFRILLGGFGFELFVRSQSRANCVNSILKHQCVKSLILQTIEGNYPSFPQNYIKFCKNKNKVHFTYEMLFFDLEKFNFSKKASLVPDSDTFTTLFIGTLFYWKGPDLLDKANKINPNKYRVIYAGDYRTINFDWTPINNKKHIRILRFLKTEEYLQLLYSTDIVVCPYRKTYAYGTSNVVLTALKLNKPVVVPNIPPFSTIINNYGCGEVFEPGNAESLNYNILKIKNNTVQNYQSGIERFKESLPDWKVIEKHYFNF